VYYVNIFSEAIIYMAWVDSFEKFGDCCRAVLFAECLVKCERVVEDLAIFAMSVEILCTFSFLRET